eukprot:gene2852-1837_t
MCILVFMVLAICLEWALKRYLLMLVIHINVLIEVLATFLAVILMCCFSYDEFVVMHFDFYLCYYNHWSLFIVLIYVTLAFEWRCVIGLIFTCSLRFYVGNFLAELACIVDGRCLVTLHPDNRCLCDYVLLQLCHFPLSSYWLAWYVACGFLSGLLDCYLIVYLTKVSLFLLDFIDDITCHRLDQVLQEECLAIKAICVLWVIVSCVEYFSLNVFSMVIIRGMDCWYCDRLMHDFRWFQLLVVYWMGRCFVGGNYVVGPIYVVGCCLMQFDYVYALTNCLLLYLLILVRKLLVVLLVGYNTFRFGFCIFADCDTLLDWSCVSGKFVGGEAHSYFNILNCCEFRVYVFARYFGFGCWPSNHIVLVSLLFDCGACLFVCYRLWFGLLCLLILQELVALWVGYVFAVVYL